MSRDITILRLNKISFVSLLFLIWLQTFGLKAEEIAYFYALDADLIALKEAGKVIGDTKFINGQSITTLEIAGNQIHAVKMGSGCIPTAISASTLLCRFPCDLAFSTGPAGRLSEKLTVGEWVNVSTVISFQQGQQTTTGFMLASSASKKLETRFNTTISASKSWKSISLSSGDTFVASEKFRTELFSTTGAFAVDMNLAGLASACSSANVPLLAWKVISDSANETASQDFAKFIKSYSGEGGRLIADLIKSLPRNPSYPNSHQNLKRLLDSSGN